MQRFFLDGSQELLPKADTSFDPPYSISKDLIALSFQNDNVCIFLLEQDVISPLIHFLLVALSANHTDELLIYRIYIQNIH